MNAKAKETRQLRKAGVQTSPAATQLAQVRLERQGWVVLPAAGALGPWQLVALHPQHGVKVICALDRVPRSSELEALDAYPVHPSWGRDVTIFSARQGAGRRPARRHGGGGK